MFRNVIEGRILNCCQQSKHLWRRSGGDIFVFPARGSLNRQLGTRLGRVNWRKSAVPPGERYSFVIDSFCQPDRAAAISRNQTRVPSYCPLRSVATRIVRASVQDIRARFAARRQGNPWLSPERAGRCPVLPRWAQSRRSGLCRYPEPGRRSGEPRRRRAAECGSAGRTLR